MSDSRSESGDDREPAAEPVDAEFEPVPERDAGDGDRPARRPGFPWLRVSLLVVLAAGVGGGAGWLIGELTGASQAGPGAPGLEARLAALETAEPAVSRADVDALQMRIAALEDSQDGSGLRADAVEQLVRDVAGLREQVDAGAAQPEQADAGDAAPPGTDSQALTALEARLEAAFAEIDARLETALATAVAAGENAEAARATAQSALDAARDSGAAASDELTAEPPEPQAGLVVEPSGNPAIDPARVAALESALAEVEAAQDALGAEIDAITELSERLGVLETEAARATVLTALAERLEGLEQAVVQAQTAAATASGAQGARSVAAQALAFTALSEAAAGSEPFAVELAALQRVWPDAPQLAALSAVARTGAPSLDRLGDTFPADALRAATGEARTFFGVLRIARDGAQGPAAAMKSALDAGDLAAALSVAETLDAEPAAAISAWRAEAEARQSVQTGLAAMGRALSAQGDAP